MRKNISKVLLLFFCTIGAVGIGGYAIDTLTGPHGSESEEAVQVVSEKALIPGGQSVGIKMDVKGVLVVGLEEIETEDSVVSPGYDAGIQIGDMILSIDGKEVYYADEVIGLIEKAKGAVSIKVSRKEQVLDFDVTPVKEYKSGRYKMGIWVKEKIAGIGTLSFYDPETNVFAALGHGIYESKTNTLLSADQGELLPTKVKSIKEGAAGIPGEIRGIFYGDTPSIGKVRENSEFGIYSEGTAKDAIALGEPMVMARRDQVEKGKAHILTTIDGDKVESFEIKITDVSRQKEADSKGIEIEVTDDRLLSYCGGIVQGMSGSPIVQNNKLVGAVTHVFVNNPTKGYGIFAEWMVEKCQNMAG